MSLRSHPHPLLPLQSEQDQAENEGEDSAVLMERLCKYIYAKDRTDRIRTCAILCHIYHHALHSRWYQARDLMLMSHLQDNIQHSDPPVQVGREGGALALVVKGGPGLCPVSVEAKRLNQISHLSG